ncbi:MAG TPA: hypothetical protein VK176_04465, partial [Phycisphaerales bacterium]|nr:hypothetical protein [Phycisphaerales bacterium]
MHTMKVGGVLGFRAGLGVALWACASVCAHSFAFSGVSGAGSQGSAGAAGRSAEIGARGSVL